ncbi:hypothetical protein CJF31_00010496 [Rutstroemia sp. NJR-2017a BVV2]|nr:hypothetical protein CJF31_00010496 [Rutstroemia sp. NJR-2017a BVV2]
MSQRYADMPSLFSNEGRSFSFDYRANGFGRGEGVGCVLLRPLDQALECNDSIRSLIRAGLDACDTGFVEAHGTGTKIGDPIEVSALHECFLEDRTPRKPLYIGSVKSNIGHLEGASGIVSVIKSSLMLEKGFILPNHDFQQPSPKIPLGDWNIKTLASRETLRECQQLRIWRYQCGNAHAVLERGPSAPASSTTAQKSLENLVQKRKMIFVLSANDEESLRKQMKMLVPYLEQRPEAFQNGLLRDLAYTLGQRHSNLSWKVAILTQASCELIPRLVSSTTTPSRAVNPPKPGFIFTGQGAQWHAMGRELMELYPIFSSTIFKIDECLNKLQAGFSLLAFVYGHTDGSCKIRYFGVVEHQPSFVMGHGSGEIASAYAAGILTLESCVAIAYYRGLSILNLKPMPSSEVLFYSSFGRAAEATELTSSYWVDNLTGTVKFSEAIQSMLMTTKKESTIPAIDVFIEIGPHPALQGPLKQILKAAGSSCTKVSYASSLVRNKSAVDFTFELAASLFMKGAHPDFKAINFPIASSRKPTVLTDLSLYPWNHNTRYWHKSRIAERHCHRQFERNDLVGTLADYSNDLEPTWRNIIRGDDIPWVRDHKIQSMVVYPMSGYIAMALEAAKQRAQLRNVVFDSFLLREVTVARPLLIPEGIPIETNITLEPILKALAIEARKAVIISACSTAVEPSAIYEDTSKMGASYGPIFQGLENCFSSDNHAMADLIIPNTTFVMLLEYETDFIIHPASLDLLIQLVWPIFGAGRTGLANFSMPSFIKKMSVSVTITRRPGDRLRVYGSGMPVPSHSLPTKFSIFATSVEEGSKPLITIDDLVVTPINDGVATPLEKPCKLCYKLEWEPVQFENDPPNNLNGSLDMHSLSLLELDIAIICDKVTWGAASELMKLLMDFHPRSIVMGPPDQVDTNGKICIILLELQNLVIAHLDATNFDSLKKMIMSSDGVLQAVRGAYTDCNSPESHMVVGMARTIRSEPLLRFSTVDISLGTPDEKAAEIAFKVFNQVFCVNSPDIEYQERCGRLMVPRVIEDTAINEYVHRKTTNSVAPILQPFHQPGRPLKIAIQIPGALDSLHFVDDNITGSALPEYIVEIQVRATSMNFKDIMISMGQLQSNYIGVECSGVECSGVISAVGSKVTNIVVGDRVAAMTEGAYSTYARCLETSTQKIPDNMSFEAAATIPVIYCTTYHSLFDLARLCKGEKVLIHAAAWGVGQAAVLLSQMVGAEIFATAGSVAMKEDLMKEYGISEDHIFYSRDISFAQGIKHATKGEGVDVVLNCLAENALRETWECLAHFGRLEMPTFEHNAMFASVDLTVVAPERPRIMKRLLEDVFGLLKQGKIRPVSPITIFSMENMETAFRTLQAGKTMGKILVMPNGKDQIMATPAKKMKDLLRADATYIIIGGTGVLGRIICKWMIEGGGRNIVLLSHSASTSGKVGELIEQAKLSEATVIIRSCDVSIKEQVDRLVMTGLSNMPPIRGVIHAAMFLDDVLFENMAYTQWESVVSAKCKGAWNFHHALSNHSLDFFIALSSVAGIAGNRGQSAHAAANTFLNAFVQYRLSRGLPAACIDLTAVSDVGYLAENSERKAQIMENLGSETISGVEVLALIGAAIDGTLEKSCNGHSITGLHIDDKLEDLFWVNDAKFKQLHDAAVATKSSISTTIIQMSLRYQVRSSASFDAARTIICDALMSKLSSVLMVPLKEMDACKPIVVYGMDSLVAIEIPNFITREFQANLQVLEFLAGDSMVGLAEIILKRSKIMEWDDDKKGATEDNMGEEEEERKKDGKGENGNVQDRGEDGGNIEKVISGDKEGGNVEQVTNENVG